MVKVRYSGIYFRPQDTKSGLAGYYIDKITTIHRPFELVVREIESTRFETRDEAEEFEKSIIDEGERYE